MAQTNLFWIGIFVAMMTVVGIFVFDNLAVSLLFGVGVGGIFGGCVTPKKTKQKQESH